MGYPTQWDFDEMDRAECARADRLAEIRERLKPYAVTWDNGASACGTLPGRFATEAEAEAYGADWFAQFCIDNCLDPDDGGHGAGYDVIRLEPGQESSK